jgi:hypothetical protein
MSLQNVIRKYYTGNQACGANKKMLCKLSAIVLDNIDALEKQKPGFYTGLLLHLIVFSFLFLTHPV